MSSQRTVRSGVSFFGMVGAVMTALKLKETWDQYRPVAGEEEGRVALGSAPSYRDEGVDDESRIGLLGETLEPKRKRTSGCCMCCGLNCSLFWKAFGIVVAILALWNGVKLVLWAFSDSPTGLESMPVFSTSLGCANAPFIYNHSLTTFHAKVDPQEQAHAFDIRGGAVGTFTVAQGLPGSEEVKYEMTLRTNKEDLLKDVQIRYPKEEQDGTILNSRLMVSTPRFASSSDTCMRYDIKMYIPPHLKKLNVQSHALMHLQFDSKADVVLDDFLVTMFTMDPNNLIVPSTHIRGKKTTLEVFQGWIVGDVAVVETTSVTTQRGDGVMNVHVHPTVPEDPENPTPAELRTTGGAGRTNVFYVTSKAFKRPIHNTHMSSRNADMYLTYREAEFNGRVVLGSKSYSATGLQPFPKSANQTDEDESSKWTHWKGNKDGGDVVVVNSRGWTGLYF